jgi:hypothetical protein
MYLLFESSGKASKINVKEDNFEIKNFEFHIFEQFLSVVENKILSSFLCFTDIQILIYIFLLDF